MGMGVNPYPPVYMGDPIELFFYRGYRYEVVIPGGYLPIAISTASYGLVLIASCPVPTHASARVYSLGGKCDPSVVCFDTNR
jgi:hypothetical protein